MVGLRERLLDSVPLPIVMTGASCLPPPPFIVMAGAGRPSTCWGLLALAVDPRNKPADDEEGGETGRARKTAFDTISCQNWRKQTEHYFDCNGTWPPFYLCLFILTATQAFNYNVAGCETGAVPRASSKREVTVATIPGSAFDDVIKGSSGDDLAAGGAGNDLMNGKSGNDLLFGQDGNDTIEGGSGNDVLTGLSGDDQLQGGSGDDLMLGGSGDDTLKGGSGADRLVAGDGDDALSGGAENDILYGNSGDDMLDGGSGDDLLSAGSGDDVLHGGAGNDKLFGEAGDDMLTGGAGNDVLSGGAGDDILRGGSGEDLFIFNGGGGNDIILDFHTDDDTLRIAKNINGLDVNSAADVAALATEDGDSTVLTFGQDTVTLVGVSVDDLQADPGKFIMVV